jgi:hypothetical protein
MAKVIVQVLDLPAVEFNTDDIGQTYYSANEIAEDAVWDFVQLGLLPTSNISSQYSVMVQIDDEKFGIDVQLASIKCLV